MATDLNIQIKINDKIVSSEAEPINVVGGATVFTWDFDDISIVDVDDTDGSFELEFFAGQLGVEIKISDNNYNLGTTEFIGSVSSVDFTSWNARSWKYVGQFLERGNLYYGQLRLIDVAGRVSEFVTFSFLKNSLPVVTNVAITPESPTIDDNLSLSYDYFDMNGDDEGETLVRWFKNGVFQRNLNGSTLINSSNLKPDDIWYADVLPNDGFEYGARVSSNSVQVVIEQSSVTDAKISPKNPNENDVLKADYKLDNITIQENMLIRWFVNEVLQNDFINSQYMRYDSSPGDVVRYEIKTESDTNFLSSSEVTIVASDFRVYDIKVDGVTESLDISTTTPNVRWKTYVPDGKQVNYTHIQIGTFYEAGNIYDEVIETSKDNFTIPANILERGVDYYLSITVSDTEEFGDKATSHFRINNSRWTTTVDNSTGWTIETIYLIQDSGDFDSSKYQLFRISDGTFYAEVRLYNNRVAFVSEDFFYVNIDTSGRNLLTIAGQGNDVKIYMDRELILDAAGLFTQRTTDKVLELGNITGSSFFVTYKYLYYTTSGSYLPGVASEFSEMQFSTFLFLADNEIVALKGYIETVDFGAGEESIDTKVFASNPDDEDESGSVFSILPYNSYRVGTVSKTYSPINNIRKSPDGKRVSLAHSKGSSIITGYLINPFNFEIDFTTEDSEGDLPLPNNNGWELVRNMDWTAAYFSDDGFNIDTITRRE